MVHIEEIPLESEVCEDKRKQTIKHPERHPAPNGVDGVNHSDNVAIPDDDRLESAIPEEDKDESEDEDDMSAKDRGNKVCSHWHTRSLATGSVGVLATTIYECVCVCLIRPSISGIMKRRLNIGCVGLDAAN